MSRSIGCSRLTTSPPIEISPSETSSSPAVIRRSVVLPDPEGPTKTRNSPSPIVRSTESTATVPPSKTFVTPSKPSSAIAPVPVRRDEVAVPERAALGRSALRREVDVHDPEAARVAVLPLEVVEQRPDVVAADVDAGGHGALDGRDVLAQVRDAIRVFDDRVPVERRIGEGRAVLGDHERDLAVVALEPQEQRGERVGLDPPAHRRLAAVGGQHLDSDGGLVAGAHDGRLVEVDAEEVDRGGALGRVAAG